MSRRLFRLVDVWSGYWVVRDHSTHQPVELAQVTKVQIVISCAFNKN
jgi:hypothetical protein